MERAEMMEALAEVGAELERRGITAKLYAVGGAVMVFAYDARDSTYDVDGDSDPRDEVTEIAHEVARRRGLPDDWLNFAAHGFIPIYRSPEWRPLFQFGSLEVVAADDRTMLAMKIRARRGQRDQPDIAVLLKHCGITTVAQALELYDEYFPEDPAPLRDRLILEFLLEGTEN